MEVARSYPDKELIHALKDSLTMDSAVKAVYREHYALLENYVLNNKGSREDAADMIQEAIVSFIEMVQENKYRGEASVKSFLYAITRNLWLAELKRRSSRDNRNRVFEKNRDMEETAIIGHLVNREHYILIQQLFEKLGEKCKQLLLLVYYENLSMNEIIQHMPDYQNEQVIRNKKYKCMKQLEQMIRNDDNLRNQFKNALRNAG